MGIERKNPVIIIGGAGDTGSEITREFAGNGYLAYVWLTRNIRKGLTAEDRFKQLSDGIVKDGGIRPVGCYADITKKGEVDEAFSAMGLLDGEKVNIVNLAAAGLRAVKRPIFKQIVTLKRAKNSGLLTEEVLKTATQNIKEISLSGLYIQSALEVNLHAPLTILERLVEGRHLGPESVVADLSSLVSDDTDPIHPDSYKGPWYYWVIGSTKKSFAEAVGQMAIKKGFKFLDFVAPVIEDTEVDVYSSGFVELVKQVVTVAEIPRVTKMQIARGFVKEFKALQQNPVQVRRVYLDNASGETTAIRPPWPNPILPEL